MNAFAAYPEILLALQQLDQCQPALLDLCIQVQQIPAPTGHEQPRAAWVEHYFRKRQLADVSMDDLPNVYARIPGKLATPAVLISAHTDTVFPIETDLAVRYGPEPKRVYGPGLGDNSAGVASLLLLAETLQSLPTPPTDIWLVANCGEEGLGNLLGMRGAVERLQNQIGAAIVLEGTGLRRIVHQALGSRRYRIHVKAPGGHSWSDFGAPSATHVLVQLAAELTRLTPPLHPRTTFNIGRFVGGTSVNTIAQHAEFELDLRSEDPAALEVIVQQTLALVHKYEAIWSSHSVRIGATLIGDRPGGQIEEDHPLVQAAYASLAACGLTGKHTLSMSSTDANIPLSCGIPAICIGITEGGNAHRLEEWINPTLLPLGMRHLLQLTWWSALWLAGKA